VQGTDSSGIIYCSSLVYVVNGGIEDINYSIDNSSAMWNNLTDRLVNTVGGG